MCLHVATLFPIFATQCQAYYERVAVAVSPVTLTTNKNSSVSLARQFNLCLPLFCYSKIKLYLCLAQGSERIDQVDFNPGQTQLGIE